MKSLAPEIPLILAPSLLGGNHTHLGTSMDFAVSLGIKWLHLDIMDGHFVPNLSFGPQTVSELRSLSSNLYFDVHLMVEQPENFVPMFTKAGAQNITIHIESIKHTSSTLQLIKSLGLQCGLAISPKSSMKLLLPHLAIVDLVLIMSVEPGFGGQSFMMDSLDRINYLNSYRIEHRSNFRIQVDGGINTETIKLCKVAGADTFVAGTAFFKSITSAQALIAAI